MNFHTHTTKLCNIAGCCNPLPPDEDVRTCFDLNKVPCEAQIARDIKRANVRAFMLTARRQGVQAAADSILRKPVNPVVPVDSRLDSFFAAGE